MSKRIIFTYLFAVILQLCYSHLYELDEIIDKMSNWYPDDTGVRVLPLVTVLNNTMAEDWYKMDFETMSITVATVTKKRVTYSNPSRTTQTLGQNLVPAGRTDVVIRLQEQWERDRANRLEKERDRQRTSDIPPISKSQQTLGQNLVPARRTDVVIQLQEQWERDRANRLEEQRDRERTNEFPPININELTGDIWPCTTFRIPKAILSLMSLSLPTTTLSKTTVTFKDHFQTYRPRYAASLDLVNQSSKKELSTPRAVYTLSNPYWTHPLFLNTKPSRFSFKPLQRVTWPTNTFMRIFTSKTYLRTHSKTSSKKILSTNDASTTDDFLNDYYNKLFGRSLPELTLQTNRTVRTYPYGDWVCYECGRNYTDFGSPFCHYVFDVEYNRLNFRKRALRYRCNGAESVKEQCFKRFVDVGWYNERGCRNWPPRRSGKTYASKRLRALEVQLHGVADGCVFTPQAYLLSYSRSVSLYVRFHVCVCSGYLCNGGGVMDSCQSLVGLSAYIVLIQMIDT